MSGGRNASVVIFIGVAIASLLGLTLLASPQRLGYFAKDGRAPLLVGAAGRDEKRRISPLWVHVKSECVDVDGLIPPYHSVTDYMHCLFPDDPRLPSRPMRLTIWGREGPDALPHMVSAEDAQVNADWLERNMLDNPIPGYRGITVTPNNDRKSRGEYFLSSGRFVSDGALAQVLRCILNWRVGTDRGRVIGGSCFGFGRYKGVVFDTAFAVDRRLDKTTMEALIRAGIDAMIVPAGS